MSRPREWKDTTRCEEGMVRCRRRGWLRSRALCVDELPSVDQIRGPWRTGQRLRALVPIFLLGIGAWISGCSGTEATETGSECASSTLIAQCPPGSDPRLDAQARSMCEAAGELNLVEQDGSFTGSCEGEGSCVVLCQFAIPCDCGVDQITTDGVFCTDCRAGAACGNGTCDVGETPETCPQDCERSCDAGAQRCNGDARQECDLRGQWDTLACPSGDTCRPSVDHAGEVECVPAR